MTTNQQQAEQALLFFRSGCTEFDKTYQRISELGFVCGPQLYLDQKQPLYDTETGEHITL